MSGRAPLAVWLYGTPLATVYEDGKGQGNQDAIHLDWTTDAYERWGDNSRVMSQLLPITAPGRGAFPHPRKVKVFIDGLLPEGNARTNYGMSVGVPEEDTYGLITHYGRDTAGALVFQPVDLAAPVRLGHYEPITSADVGERLLQADSYNPTDHGERGDESISLAGMQPKIGVHRDGEHWFACKEGAPSTWIIKLAHPKGSRAEDVIDTEVLCLGLARTLGLTTVAAEVIDFGGVRGIAVRRYDRTDTDPIERIHQEDLAQALGINTQDPRRKFQRGNRTPSLREAVDVLRGGLGSPEDLLRLVTFNHLIGNTDFHAKNLSVLRLEDGRAELSPAYDMAMHMHHVGGERLSALDINGKYRMADISVDDLIAEALSWKSFGERVAVRLVTETADALADALVDLDLTQYPGVRPVATKTVDERVAAARADLANRAARAAVATAPSTRRRGPRRR